MKSTAFVAAFHDLPIFGIPLPCFCMEASALLEAELGDGEDEDLYT